MRVAHIVSTYPPYRGGMGNVARELAQRTVDVGFEVRVLTPAVTDHEETRHVRAGLRYGNAAWCPSIGHQLIDGRYTIAHLHWPFIGTLGMVLRWRRRYPNRRLVVQYHMDLVATGARGAAFSSYVKRALPNVVSVADAIVATSRDYAEHGALAEHIETLGDRFMEIPLGVDAERFTPQVGNRQPGPFRLLFVGALDVAHAFKGLPLLLEAIERVPRVQLCIVGDGPLREKYEARARTIGIEERVTFLGSVSDEDLPQTYLNSDVVVLPSTARSEAFGLVLLEGMACGKPVITSELPGVRTVVSDGEAGLLIEPGDVQALERCIIALRDDLDRVARMGAAARARVVKQYTWKNVAHQWRALYDQILKAR
ncbi:MAG: glycosyltransferase family 4 protein [Candidatus Uhrbacteria bacterium]